MLEFHVFFAPLRGKREVGKGNVSATGYKLALLTADFGFNRRVAQLVRAPP